MDFFFHEFSCSICVHVLPDDSILITVPCISVHLPAERNLQILFDPSTQNRSIWLPDFLLWISRIAIHFKTEDPPFRSVAFSVIVSKAQTSWCQQEQCSFSSASQVNAIARECTQAIETRNNCSKNHGFNNHRFVICKNGQCNVTVVPPLFTHSLPLFPPAPAPAPPHAPGLQALVRSRRIPQK